jgi:hypothetical protein
VKERGNDRERRGKEEMEKNGHIYMFVCCGGEAEKKEVGKEEKKRWGGREKRGEDVVIKRWSLDLYVINECMNVCV